MSVETGNKKIESNNERNLVANSFSFFFSYSLFAAALGSVIRLLVRIVTLRKRKSSCWSFVSKGPNKRLANLELDPAKKLL